LLPTKYLLATDNTCTYNSYTETFTNTTNALFNNTWGFTLNPTNLTNQQLYKVPNNILVLEIFNLIFLKLITLITRVGNYIINRCKLVFVRLER